MGAEPVVVLYAMFMLHAKNKQTDISLEYMHIVNRQYPCEKQLRY